MSLPLEPIPVGSVADLATLLVIIVVWRRDLKDRLTIQSAGLVALALDREDVDDDRLRAELEVDDRDVQQLRTDGGRDG